MKNRNERQIQREKGKKKLREKERKAEMYRKERYERKELKMRDGEQQIPIHSKSTLLAYLISHIAFGMQTEWTFSIGTTGSQ